MSETFANNTPAQTGAVSSHDVLLDGDAPRLGDAPAIPPASQQPAPPPLSAPTLPTATVSPATVSPDKIAPELGAPTLAAPQPPAPSEVPSLPVVSPVLTSGAAPKLPDIVAPVAHDAETDDEATDPSDPTEEKAHPMAHLMPSKSVPSEASRHAAELRAARRAKSKKIKIGVAAGALVFSAVVGPPLGKWLVDAINEAGDTSTEEPAE